MKRTTIALLATLLCACAGLPQSTASKVERREIDKWVGRSADDLVVAKGAPVDSYILDSGVRVYGYLKNQIVVSHTKASAYVQPHPSGRRRGDPFLPPVKNEGPQTPRSIFPTSGPSDIFPRELSISQDANTAGAPLRKRNQAPRQSANNPCMLLFNVSATNIIESWSSEGDQCD